MKTKLNLAAKVSLNLFGVHPCECSRRPFGVHPSVWPPRLDKLERGHRIALLLLVVAALTTVSLLLSPASARAQGGVPLWTNRYPNAAFWDGVSALAVDRSGNVFVTGVVTIKYSNAGTPIWTNQYGGQGIAVDSNGNVFVGLATTIAYSSLGLSLWTNYFSASNGGMAVDGAGNVFVTGTSWDGSNYDFATVKYSNAGLPLWTNYYDGPASLRDESHAIVLDGSGNVFVTGSSYNIEVFPTDVEAVTIKYSNTGLPLWTNRYHGLNGAAAGAIAVDGNGSVFVTAGTLRDAISANNDFATIKYSNSGVPLWTNLYNGPANRDDIASAIAVDHSGNVFVTGQSVAGNSLYDYATIAYSNTGIPLWTNRYDGPAHSGDRPTAMAVDSNGNVFVTGSSSVNDTNVDYLTIAYTNAGVPLWINRYSHNGPGSTWDVANAIAVDSSGNVFVTGSSGDDMVTIKYSSSVPPPGLDFQKLNNQLVLSWTNAGFSLQSAPAVTGPFTNVPASTSPYTNSFNAPQRFFRLAQ